MMTLSIQTGDHCRATREGQEVELRPRRHLLHNYDEGKGEQVVAGQTCWLTGEEDRRQAEQL